MVVTEVVTASDQPDGQPVEVDLTKAATALGITREALRSRIRRGLVKARQEGGRWLVTLPVMTIPDHGQVDRVDQVNRSDDRLIDVASLRDHLTATEHERDGLAADKRYLQAALEREQAALQREQLASAELRRLLGNAQQQLTAALAQPAQLPSPQDAAGRAEEPEKPPTTAEPVHGAALQPARSFWARLFGR
jgi:hypothetical protein